MKIQKYKQVIIISIVATIVFLGSMDTSFSQLQVAANNNASQLANQLAGQGVTITNATLNCPSGACGTFNGSASNLGISGGIMLTSGSVTNAVGPNVTSMISTNNNVQFSDPNLIAIEPRAFFDPCILKFTFVPTCNTISFTFAFGSDEYHEFVDDIYNDVFGIFVTGPNPSGPAYNGYNMALIPSTTTPVSINNVNNGWTFSCNAIGPCSNCAYFVDNCGGTTVEYDGFTTPITATLKVVPCSTYQFKLAIADAGDSLYDAGVFFKQGSLTCNSSPLSLNTNTTPAQCSSGNGAATVMVSGGTQPYTYTWSTTPPQNTATATGLSPGNYTVTVKDASGCFTGTATVTIANVGGFTLASSQTNATCFGASNGSSSVTPSGGNAPYTYSWNTNPVQITSSISNIPAGNYTVMVTDATGCSSTQTITISQPAAITTSATATSAACGINNGSASLTTGGGTAPYTYLWNASGQTTSTATGLLPGNYTVTITDANGCTQTATIAVTQTGGPSVTTSSTPQTCTQGGTATATASGGTAPYTYQWCNGQTLSTATGLSAGSCTVIVTDANGCSTLGTVIITASGNVPVVNVTSVPASCNNNNGVATANVSGGTSPYTYSWNNGQTTFTATGLSAGNYTVTVTDASGCTQKATAVITINGPTALAGTAATILSGSSASLTASGGATYSWVPSASGGLSCAACTNPVATPTVTTEYCVYVFDTSACYDSACVTVFVVEPINCIGAGELFIPNAFSPNGDGENDVLQIYYGDIRCIETFKIGIYDRWGEKVYETTGPGFQWDGKYKGKVMNTSTMAYYMKIIFVDGKEIVRKGNISIVK